MQNLGIYEGKGDKGLSTPVTMTHFKRRIILMLICTMKQGMMNG